MRKLAPASCATTTTTASAGLPAPLAAGVTVFELAKVMGTSVAMMFGALLGHAPKRASRLTILSKCRLQGERSMRPI
jgi:predicted oxidoreductase